MKMKQKCCFF